MPEISTAIPTSKVVVRPPVPELVFDKLRIKKLTIDANRVDDPVVAICELELFGIDELGNRVVADIPTRKVRIDDLLGKLGDFPEAAVALGAIIQLLNKLVSIEDAKEPEPIPTPTP